MSTKRIFRNLHYLLWFINTALTGILAGFLISHSIMLGRFFSWLIANGKEDVFTDAFAPFRATTRANVHYNAVLWLSLGAGLLWLISSLLLKCDRVLAFTAGLSSFWVGAVFFASGFGDAEAAVCSGAADVAMRRFYAALNLPLHRGFAAAYSLAFLILLWAGSRARRQQKTSS